MNIEGNFDYPFGTGGFYDQANTTPQPTNFWGMSNWYTVPTTWYIQGGNGSQWRVSPTWDFSNWVFDAKVNFDGTLVFQCQGFDLFGIQQLPVTTPS